jgi:hypothetical protein
VESVKVYSSLDTEGLCACLGNNKSMFKTLKGVRNTKYSEKNVAKGK